MKLKDLRRMGQRLTRMDRGELRHRLRQEFYKRQEGLFHRLHLDSASGLVSSLVGPAGKFFFDPASLDSLLALLRERLPGQIEQILHQAEKICRHRFDLLGYRDLDFGSVIDWHADPVHAKRAPSKLFYRVRYLDFDEVGDSKITWELNRHQHLVTLAKAYRLTGDTRFSEELVRQWRDWHAENPYPVGINWASSLEVAFRSLSWVWVDHLLRGSPQDFSEFHDELVRGLAIQGRHIERYLSTYFSPNTHLLGEAVALFFLGTLYPQIAAAQRWQALGWEMILAESSRQVRDDGFHFEQSTYYHVYALDFFLHSVILASLNNVPIPQSLEDVLQKMLTAVSLLGRWSGPPRFGDDDGGRLFDPRRNLTAHLIDPLAAGAILFQRGDWKRDAADLREETIWLLGAAGGAQWDALDRSDPICDSAALAPSGFYLLAAATPPAQLVVDAGPQGTQSGGHGHADALGISLQSRGPLLIDPGTFSYVGGSEGRDLFRGTAMHNTLQVDGLDQSEVNGPFSWKRLTQTNVEHWIQGPGFDLLAASHDGYQRLPQPVTHRRWVFSLRSGLYFVRDCIEGQGQHRLDITWHLAPQMQLVERNVFRAKGASHGLAIIPMQSHGWEEVVRKGVWSPVYGQRAAINVLGFGTSTGLPAEFSTLLLALEEVHPAARSFSRIGEKQLNPAVSGYRHVDNEAEYSFFFGQAGKPWRCGNVSSDAEFVCWKGRIGDGDQLLIVCNGSYTQIEDGPELRCRRPVRWCELHFEGGQRNVRSSDPEAVNQSPGVLLGAGNIQET